MSWRKKNKMMTMKEMLESVIAGTINDEVIEKAQAMLDAKAHEAERRNAKAAEKRAERLDAEAGIVDAIVEGLGTETLTASQIAEKFELKSAQKATILVKRAVADGRVEQVEIKVDGRKVKGYKLV